MRVKGGSNYDSLNVEDFYQIFTKFFIGPLFSLKSFITVKYAKTFTTLFVVFFPLNYLITITVKYENDSITVKYENAFYIYILHSIFFYVILFYLIPFSFIFLYFILFFTFYILFYLIFYFFFIFFIF